jgi:RND family efflux transporter MFP subunit
VAATGLVEGASREVALLPEVAGTLTRIQVRVGETVAPGALLFELSNDAQQAQVALAEAELASARAQAQQAAADHSRSARLMGPQAVSRQNYETDQYRLASAQAKVTEAEARLRLAQAELAKTRVQAPRAGQVLQIPYEPGTFVEPRKNADPVVRLADVSRRRVRAWVEELAVERVAVGQRAHVTADGFPGQEFPGTIVEVAGRMGKEAPHSDAPGEYRDIYYREVVIDLDGARELPLNLRVQVYIDCEAAQPPQRAR